MAGKRTGVGKVVARSATSPLNLSVFGAAAVGAVALMSWPIAALGGVAYAALVASDVASPEFRKKALRRGGGGSELPRPKDLEDPELRQLVEQIQAARAEIATTLTETPERVRKNLTTTRDALEELAGHAAVLVLRARDLGAYLERVDLDGARQEAAQHGRRASTSDDADESREYQLAATAASERVAALEDLEKGRARILANLTRIVATLRSVPPKIVRMRALDDRASDALTGDFDRELGRMNTDLRAFEETLVSLAEVTP
jgi:hypothetical protein